MCPRVRLSQTQTRHLWLEKRPRGEPAGVAPGLPGGGGTVQGSWVPRAETGGASLLPVGVTVVPVVSWTLCGASAASGSWSPIGGWSGPGGGSRVSDNEGESTSLCLRLCRAPQATHQPEAASTASWFPRGACHPKAQRLNARSCVLGTRRTVGLREWPTLPRGLAGQPWLHGRRPSQPLTRRLFCARLTGCSQAPVTSSFCKRSPLLGGTVPPPAF